MKFPATRGHGFTLIEMIVVILVIGTLAALLVPAAQRTLDRAKSAQAKNDVTQIATNPYGANNGAGPLALRQGVIAWSLGKDGGLGKVTSSNPTGNNIFTGSDDIISWQ